MKLTKVGKNTFNATFKQNINNNPIEIQTDKYLFDRKKTIGFRKDKKLFKFVGLRDGYSKQLELTVKSIIIDGEEKIASNRVNFSEISLSGDTVVHNINGLDFFNRIDLSNYKNLIKIEEEFTNLDIIYEIHLKGIKIEENSYRIGGKNVFRQNHLGQYFIIDDGNETSQFTIENPIAMDSDGRSYNILTHELYKEGGKYYYKKTILNNPLEALPLYVDANITFNPTTYANIQSYVNNNDDTSWDNARNGIGMLFLNTQNNTINSFEYKPSQLFTSWIDFSGGNFHEYTLSNFKCRFYYSLNDYVITNWFEVVTGETINVSSYNSDLTMGSSDNPDIIVWESGSTMTSTTYNWSIDSFETSNHTCSTGTTHVAVSINPRNPGDWFYLNFYNFYVRKQGITATNYYESYIERQFLYFDTSQLYQIAINKIELDFTLVSPSGGEYAIQKANTASDNIITTSDFNSYQGTPYATFDASGTTYTVDLGQGIIDDYVDNTVTKLVIRENEYDYIIDTPTPNYIETLTHNWSHQLNVELGLFIVTEKIILDFQLESTGFGVIYSSGTGYTDAYNGVNSPYVIHSSISGSYNSGATYIWDLATHDLWRTFLHFDTSILSIYDRYIIQSAKIVVKNHNYNADITISEGLQGTVSGLTGSEWTNVGQFYANAEGIALDSSFEVEVGGDSIDVSSGNTRYVIRNKVYDYEQNSGTTSVLSSINGMNFNETYLEIELDPYTIYGINYIQVEKGKEIDLFASRNTSDGEIFWGLDSGITNVLGSGNTLHINTINYNQGDYIYAAILNTSGETISYNTLAIYLDLFTYEFNSLPERNFNVHDVDLDAVYFKYHQCLSGATYAYVRELDDIYEQNAQVSDGEGLGSYNMYNEWDIIDEFFSNSHEVEVVGRLDEMDLNISYKKIEGVYIHEGTRVLLHSVTPTADDGVYVADFNLKLHKTDELEDADAAFRYKAHVGAGDYLDYEFHTKYYPPDPGPPDPFDFDELDANIYGEDVIDFIVYSEYLFDSNVFS